MIPKAIDVLCDEFESSLRRNEPTRIEDLLLSVGDSHRPQLLYELAGIEIELSVRRGKVVYLDELRHRFPTHPEAVNRVVRSFLWEGSELVAVDWTAWQPVLNQFRLKAIIGRGSFGTVWLADDMRLNREVAIKTPHAYGGGLNASDAVIGEASAVARLRHPHILPVHEVGEAAGGWFMVTDYAAGGTLKQLLASQSISAMDAARIGAQLADALHHAHSHGVFHRDLKPSNILVDERGNPLIADFGLAITAQQTGEHSAGMVCGSQSYMAPEQAAGRIGGERADIYSLGVILEDLLEVAVASVSAPGGNTRPGGCRLVTRSLLRIRDRCCHLNPTERYASAQDLADDFKRLADGRPPRGVSADRREVAEWFVRRNWRGLCLSLAAAVVACGAALSAGPQPHPDSRRTLIRTEPPGCEIVVVPLDSTTLDPIVGRLEHAPRKSPVEMPLVPGDYLIVASKDSTEFHEVHRHVPHPSESVPFRHPHHFWRMTEGVVELPAIKVSAPSSRIGLVEVPEHSGFLVTSGRAPSDLAQRLRVPGFHAAKEPLSPDVVEQNGRRADDHSDPEKTAHNHDTAMALAERSGLRLPSAAEYASMTAQLHQLEPLGLTGLNDQAGEWTSSNPGAIGTGLVPPPPTVGQSHVAIMGLAGTSEENSLGEVVHRLEVEYRLRLKTQPDIASRLVRSNKPRTTAEDFATAAPGIARESLSSIDNTRK